LGEPTVAIRLQESLRAIFYAPFYATLARNAFAAEGVEVHFVSAPTPGDAARTIMDGAADVCWGGPMRVMQTYEQIPGCDLICFGEAVTRDPFLLVGHAPRPAFPLADLASLCLATIAEVPTPWMCLQDDLRRAGIDPAQLNRISDHKITENVAALRRGEVDVVQVLEPFAASLEADDTGHVWYAAATRGPTSYTTFYARHGTLATRHGELTGMVRALYRTQRWMSGANAQAIADTIARFFHDVPRPILVASCARYQSLGVWGHDPHLPRDGYERLRTSLVSGGFVSEGTPYDVAVDNSLADAVIAENQRRE
jgi:NitT/TauT family transport system substrate-binding protein